MTKQLILAVLLSSAVVRGGAFQVNQADPQPWLKILGAVGISPSESNDADIVIAGPAAPASIAALAENHLLVLEGVSPAARSLGITAKTETLRVRQIRDTHAPDMQIFWEQPSEVAVAEVTPGFQVFAREGWTGAPM